MKHRVFLIAAALLCGTILLFAASLTAFAQSGVKTAEFELNPPAETFDAVTGGGIFHFSFATGKMEWVPFRRPANIQELAELAMRERNPEKAPAGLDFSIRGEIDMRKTPIMILSEDEIKSILSTGKLPEKKPTTKSQGMKPDSYYLLKDETDQSTYVFKLRDHSPGYIWQQLAYVRIPDGTSWKKNPDLTVLLNMPPAIDGLKSITISGSGVPNLAEGKMKEVEAPQNDLKAYYPAAAKVGDFVFFSQGKSPIRPNGTPFKKELLNEGCDYFDGVDAYPGEGDTLLLSLNKRCTVIPDDKVESLCKDPAKLVGDYYGVPMDITAAEQPMVLLETSAKKLFLIVGLDISPRGKLLYLEVPRGGISKEQANAIREYRPLQKKKMDADMTMRQMIQESNRKEAERKQAEEQARQDAMNKRIEDVKQQSSGDTFPKTEEEIKLVEDLIMSAKYEELLKLCEGKKLDFNVKSTRGDNMSLLYRALYHNSRNLNQSRLDRKNMIFEFVLNNGGAPVIFTEEGMNCVFFAARTNNKKAFDLLLKNGFDPNRKGPNGKTVLEFLVEQNIKVDPEIMNKLKATTKPSLFSMVLESNADGLKKALEDKENRAAVNTPIEPTGGGVAGKTLLEYALSPKDGFPHTETVKTLLAAGAKFKEKNISGLMLSKQEHLLPLFWEYRDRMSGEDWNKCFNYAALYRNTDAFKFFLEKGLDPEKPENSVSTRTPRFNAYLQGTPEMVDMLEARGFKKPFWAAIRWNELDLVKEYLAAGADVNEADKVSRSKPIMLALSTGNVELAELLLEHGVKVSPDDYRRAGEHYPVEIAAHGGQTKIMELLLKHGFVPDFPQTPGDTKHPHQSSGLYMALSYKNYETAKVLLKYGARTDLTREETVFDRVAGKRVKKDVTLEEHFSHDPEALKVLKGKIEKVVVPEAGVDKEPSAGGKKTPEVGALGKNIGRNDEIVAGDNADGEKDEAKNEIWASEELLDIVDRLPGILSAKHTPNFESAGYQKEAAELEDILESAKPDAEIIRIVLEKYPKAKPEKKTATESPANKPKGLDLKNIEQRVNQPDAEADAHLRAAAEKAVRALAEDGDAGAKTIVKLFYAGQNKDEDFLKAMKSLLLTNTLSIPKTDSPETLDSDEFKSYLDAVVKTAQKLAEDGDVRTQLMLGAFYVRANRLPEAVKWLGMAADNGIAQAAMLNGEIYLNGGPGLEPDFAEALNWYIKAAELGDKTAPMILAEHCRLGGHGMEPDLPEAVKWYKKAAELDDQNGRAMYRLGECYEYGFGVEPDLKAASEWYDRSLHHAVRMGWFGLKRCAAKGSADAMCDIAENIANNCAFSYRYLSNFHEEAAKWRRQAADQGNARAMRELAEAHREGMGVLRDDVEAFKLLRAAAEQGDAESMFYLADCYDAGEGVKRDVDEAIKWYRRAAERGEIHAQNHLGFLYERVIQYKNLPEAIKYYRMAAAQGDEAAKTRLENLEAASRSREQSKDLPEPVGSLMERVLQPFPDRDAMYGIALCYENGNGVRQDDAEAYKWYLRTVLGNPRIEEAGLDDLKKDLSNRITTSYHDAQYKLGVFCETGRGTEQNMEKALFWYRRADSNGSAAAKFRLGELYERGLGVEQDPKKAAEYYRVAGDHPGAKEALARVRRDYSVKTDLDVLAEKAEQGDVSAMTNLAWKYDLEARTARSGYAYADAEIKEKEAVKWYRKAAELGEKTAQYLLGTCYENGRGVPKDEDEAAKWYRESSEQGYRDATASLGKYYGRRGDYREALQCFLKIEDRFAIARCYDLLGNEAEAFKWYRKAGEPGNYAKYTFYLALCYFEGKGTEPDYDKAVKLFSDAGDYIGPWYHLGLCYENGLGVPKDPEKAFYWFSQAAEYDMNYDYEVEAKEKLAYCYENGFGVEKNLAEAEKWKKIAAEQKRNLESNPVKRDPFNPNLDF
jgi:hypothetical protein